jgi:hypothetical protein
VRAEVREDKAVVLMVHLSQQVVQEKGTDTDLNM